MKGRTDAEMVRYRTVQIKLRTGQMKDLTDAGQDRYRTEKMLDRTDAGKDECRTGRMLEFKAG